MASQSDMARLDELRRQVDAATADPLTPAINDFANQARSVMAETTHRLRHQLEIIAARISSQPVFSIIAATSIGWALALLKRTRRR